MQSRYYDPEITRFINADSYASTGQGILGNNMFAYCLNNPVNHADFGGYECDEICYDGKLDDELFPKPEAPPSNGPMQSDSAGSSSPGRSYNFNGNHGTQYMKTHGWNYDTIDQAVSNGRIGCAINKATGNPSTVYGHPEYAGHYVVIDDFTSSIVQLSNLKYAVWHPDSTIILIKENYGEHVLGLFRKASNPYILS